MKKIIYSLMVLACLSSCNSVSGSSGPAKSPEQQMQEAASAKDFSATIVPNNFSVIKANLSYDEQKERYTIGCKTPGVSYPSLNVVDQSLMIGQLFKTERAGDRILSKGWFSAFEESVVTAIEDHKISIDSNYDRLEGFLLPFTDINQIFTKKPHMKNEITILIGASGDITIGQSSVANNLSPAAKDFIQAHSQDSSSYVSCQVDDLNSKTTKSSVDKISYNLNGQSIVAYLERRIIEGEVFCSRYFETNGRQNDKPDLKVSMGHGRVESTTVSTNNLVKLGFENCGGSEIYRLSRTSLDSGKILDNYIQKTLSAPQR
jgi:hypothetical protein